MEYDFSGYATRNDLKCSDGRIIRRDAFKECDGKTVPLVWNHMHDGPENILGHALLENRDDGVYAYCKFNDTESAQTAKLLVKHGDINALSIYANGLKQQGLNVEHGTIREVSLVLAGANVGAFIDSVSMSHGEEASNEEGIIYTGENFSLYHSEKDEDKKEEKKEVAKEKTVADVFDTLTEEQKTVVYALIGQALEENEKTDDKKEEDDSVKHNVFDNDNETGNYLTHADEINILNSAKSSSVGSLQAAIDMYLTDSSALKHAFDDDDLDSLFPEYKDVRPGAPELISRDQGWITAVMNGTAKSPITRIRTRQMDIRDYEAMRAYGYVKGNEKSTMGNMKLVKRTTDPQTIYIKDALNRDDIIDITDFDVVAYLRSVMKQNLNEEIATAIMIGDGRDEGDDNKISEEHIRPIWGDDELYTIYVDVDIDAAAEELNGTNTSAQFGENYIYAEAIITAALYAREDYKGSGSLAFYCTPHLLNVMLLARDLNGRRIYDSKTDLAAALNVTAIYTAEQFEGRTRTDDDGNTKELLGLFVNLTDYQIGCAKGGEITNFSDFDIDFNQEKYLMETRISGALTRVYSAIALELPVEEEESESE